MWSDDWSGEALCKETRSDQLFATGAAQNLATRVCGGCPVKSECLAEALDHQIEWGVWGGMTERQRRALLLRRPNVTSWRRLLETAMAHHESVAGVAAARPPLVNADDQQLVRTWAV